MKAKLENLIELSDFKTAWRAEQAKKTKRTETGLDILKEGLDDELESDLIGDGIPDDGIEEIIPEGLPEDVPFDELEFPEQIDHIIDELPDLDDDIIDNVVDYLREVLLDMEQEGVIDNNFTDDLDDSTAGEWKGWIEEVMLLNNLPEEAIKGVSDIIFGGSREDRWEDDDDDLNDDGTDYIDDKTLDDDTSENQPGDFREE